MMKNIFTEEQSRPVFPFTAIVGQEEMKLALLLNVVDPRIGGVIVLSSSIFFPSNPKMDGSGNSQGSRLLSSSQDGKMASIPQYSKQKS